MTCACIYAIICPFTKKVMYIGQTHTLDMRTQSHMYAKNTSIGFWLREVLAAGKEPIIRRLKIIKYPKNDKGDLIFKNIKKQLNPIESEMIKKYSKKGEAIFNNRCNPNYSKDFVVEYLNNLPF